MVTSHKFTITSITWSSTQYDKLITSSLEQVTWKEAHIPALWEKLMKDTGWLSALFHEVDWPAHKKAFTGLGRFRHLSTCKLIHDLILQRTSRNDTMANPVYALVGKKTWNHCSPANMPFGNSCLLLKGSYNYINWKTNWDIHPQPNLYCCNLWTALSIWNNPCYTSTEKSCNTWLSPPLSYASKPVYFSPRGPGMAPIYTWSD